MKYISFAIPCYNSQDYMAHAIESILPGGEDVEIIIVNDGSKDRTSEIAHDYMEKYPTIVKVVDKENGGHGDAVNSGLTHATGKYFKVVDSDDWVDEDALHKILEVLRHMEEDAMELRGRWASMPDSAPQSTPVPHQSPSKSLFFSLYHLFFNLALSYVSPKGIIL